MKRILLSLALAAATAFNADAVVQVFTVPAGAVPQTNFFTLSSRINSVTVSTGVGGTINLSYTLVDQPTNNVLLGWGPLKQTNAAYASIGQYLTNITKITTNFSGVTYTNTFTNAVFTFTNTVSIGSNDWRRLIGSPSIVGSNGASVTITGPFPVIYGLGITNHSIGVPITVTVDYDPAL